jgi:hypothetical protein
MKDDDIRVESTGRSRSHVNLVNSGYELLRLDRRRWRETIAFLLSPAARLHNLKDVRTRMWREAICEVDCNVGFKADTDVGWQINPRDTLS